ncbi:MAG: DUF5522 domain-containing protein [Bacteroidota bacterium]|jgi:hypothetical protein
MEQKSKKRKKLVEGEDFYYNERGFMVLTAKYHLENGRCCGNECVNCPYDHVNVPGKRDRVTTDKRAVGGNG